MAKICKQCNLKYKNGAVTCVSCGSELSMIESTFRIRWSLIYAAIALVLVLVLTLGGGNGGDNPPAFDAATLIAGFDGRLDSTVKLTYVLRVGCIIFGLLIQDLGKSAESCDAVLILLHKVYEHHHGRN